MNQNKLVKVVDYEQINQNKLVRVVDQTKQVKLSVISELAVLYLQITFDTYN